MQNLSVRWAKLTRSSWPKLWKWFIAGYAVRILLMPITSSVDQTALLWESSTLLKSGMLVPSGDWPLVFYLLAPFLYIDSLANPTAYTHIFKDALTSQTFNPFVASLPFRLTQTGINAIVFAAKIPYLIFDVATAFLLLHSIDDVSKAVWVFKLWLLNPIAIYISYAVGQYDIIPAFLLLLAIYLYKKERYEVSALSLGLSAAFKPFTLLFIPMLALHKAHKSRTSTAKLSSFLGYAILGVLPFAIQAIALIAVPNYYYQPANAAWSNFEYFNGFFGNKTFVNGFLYSHPVLSGFTLGGLDFPLKIQLSATDIIYYLPALFTAFFLFIYYFDLSFSQLLEVLTSFLLLYYAFSHFHVQWFLWVQPLLVWLMAEKNKKLLFPYLLTIPLFFVYTWQYDPLLSSALFLPISSNALNWATPSGYIQYITGSSLPLIDVGRSILSAILVFMILLIFDFDVKIKRLMHATDQRN